jgi:hypothetical protein
MPTIGNTYVLHWKNSNDKPDISIVAGSQDATSTDLVLQGQGRFDWGEITQQNLLWILENFSDIQPPSYPTQGQLWWDSVNKKLFVYNGTQWIEPAAAAIVTSDASPTDASKGLFWFNGTTKLMYVWNGTTWTKLYTPFSTASAFEPVAPENGQLWVDIGTNVLKFWSATGSQWITVGPYISNDISLTRNLPAVGQTIEVGSYVSSPGGTGTYNLIIGITVDDNNFSVAKSYILPVVFGKTLGTWAVVTPTECFGGPANDFELEANVNQPTLSFRLRRTIGTDVGLAKIQIRNIGPSGQTFTPSSTVTSPAAVTARYKYQHGGGEVHPRDTFINVQYDHGARGDGLTDDTAVIQAAINVAAANANGGTIYFPSGTYKITSTLTVPDYSKVMLKGDGVGSVIKKFFNGDLIYLGAQCQMEALFLHGQDNTYTGRGVAISTGTNDELSWRKIRNCSILYTEQEAIGFTTLNVGYGTMISHCRLFSTNVSTPAIRFNGHADVVATIEGCFTGSNPIASLSGANGVIISNCTGGAPIYTSLSSTITLTGSTIVSTTTPFVYDGNTNTVTGCTIAGTQIVFNSTLQHSTMSGCTTISNVPVLDNSAGTSQFNKIWYPNGVQLFTPGWITQATQPVLGNGTLTGFVERRGEWAKVNVQLVIGSTTTFGSGEWIFTMPYSVNRITTGSGMIRTAGGNWYTCVCMMQTPGSNWLQVQNSSLIAPRLSNNIPFAWSAGDTVIFDIDFPIN